MTFMEWALYIYFGLSIAFCALASALSAFFLSEDEKKKIENSRNFVHLAGLVAICGWLLLDVRYYVTRSYQPPPPTAEKPAN